MTEFSGYMLEKLCEGQEFYLYRGWQVGQTAPVLVLAPVAEQPSPATLKRLEHEFSLAAELDPEWAARPLKLARHDGRLALVLEDLGGEPLVCAVGQPLELTRFLQVAIGLVEAVGKVHRRGIIHKDINPANVLVDPADNVWLTGFGIASRLPRERQAPAPPEFITGTLAYMAPEQTGRMNRSMDARSDLYSVGVTLYQMLTGRLPFVGSDAMEWIHCHIARRPTLPNQYAPIPEPISAIVLKLLAKTAEERYQSAAGLKADLQWCLTAWEARRRIDPFPLGAHDASDRLLIPEKLYGREAEIDALVTAFDRVVTRGTTELVLVSGYSGIGKSSIVNELHKVLVPPRGYFAAGKFDQYKRDIPYATLAQAFQSLVRQLLSKNDEELGQWRLELQKALGPNGQLMVNLIPELALIIGEQPPVPDLPPQDAQNRFQLVFRRLLGVFARREHPLALFLDDLQWLDAATLDLLRHLVIHEEVRHLMLVGAYRDNEVSPSHPLMLALDVIRKAGAPMHEIVLAPLMLCDIDSLVADALHTEEARALPLAELVFEKTAGNPFFAIQFITALAEEGLVEFDPEAHSWQWDMDRIRAKSYTDNVVDLLAGKLIRLPGTTREVLKDLACLGNSAELATLATVQRRYDEEIHEALWDAVGAGLILRLNGTYRFLHDRVQEAAYALIPESLRATAHLRIGRMLLGGMGTEATAEQVFDVVNQLNRSVDLIDDVGERASLRRLNILAGTKARSAIAYFSARNYLAQAAALLPQNAWTQCYEETFDLYLAFSECEYLVGNFAAADELFDLILGMARSDLDRAKVYSLRIKLYQVAGKYDNGLAVALDALRLFGVSLPESNQDIQVAVGAEFREISINLGGRPIGDLLDTPAAASPAMRAIINLLVDAVPCAYIARPNLFPLIALKALNLSVRHGNTDQSSFVYAIYAIMLVSVVGDIPSAFQFSELSLQLNEKFNNPRLRGTLLHLHGDHINFWRRHIATGLPILEQAFLACLEVGDLVYAGFLAFETVWQVIEKGDALEDVLALSVKYAAFTRQSHNDAVYETIRLEQRFVASLQGKTTDPLNFDDDGFDEAECFAAIVRATFGCGIVFYHIMKQMLAFLYGRHLEALDSAFQAEPVLGAAMSMPIEATYHFYHVLTLTALYPTAFGAKQQEYWRIIEEKLKKLKLWADNCPENFGNRYALASAEVARIEGRQFDAMRLYDEAVHSAHEFGFIQNEGLANELAARFYAARGFETIAHAYLRNARYCYLRWGADGKVRQLDQLHPHLYEEQAPPGPITTIGTPVEHLDLATVVKTSQAVSGEILLEKLIQTLMVIALEHAGAERGLLILPRGDELRIEAEATTGRDTVEVLLRQTDVTASELPESVLHYVIRTQESVVLDDASAPNQFSGDEYVLERHSRSVLCLPLVKQAQLIGVLYLENHLAPQVFTPERLAVLKLLASQAAISLENAGLYADLHQENSERKRAEEALRRSEAYLAKAQRLSFTGSFGWNVSSGEIFWSEQSFRIFEYGPAIRPTIELILERVHPEDVALVKDTLDHASQLKDWELKHRLLVPGGVIKYVHVVAQALRDESGKLEFVGAIMDVTAANMALQEIRTLRDQLYKENVALRDEVDRASMFEEIVGTSAALQTVLANVSKVARTDSTVLITGETGTGKELIARAIHKRSQRSARAFVSVNCAAIPPSLIASELFGHEKGAFTGATQRRLGRFELADGGTIFLDEIGDLPLDTQLALLRVLQEREFERVGGTRSINVDVRVISATNRDLETALTEGEFRSDLFYRLNVFPIQLPPLRARREDIPLLVEYFIDRFATKAGKEIRLINKKSLDLLRSYSWPGNIRELQNVVERAVIVSEAETFSVDESWLSRDSVQTESTSRQLLKMPMADEKEMIETALAETKGRVAGPAGAAARLGIPASTLDSKIKALKVNKNRFKSDG